MGDAVKISVHAVIGETGFLVKVVAAGRCQKFPAETYDEAEALAISIKEYVEMGLPIDGLVGDAVATGEQP